MTPAVDVYAPVNTGWPAGPAPLPPVTREEATRAAARLVKHFKGPRHAARVRRVWITRDSYSGLQRGWRRLVHDVSHRVYDAQRSRLLRPHGGIHAHLEREMVEYVVTKGWLTGTLRSKPAVPLSTDQRRAKELKGAREAIVTWQRKQKLAGTKIKVWQKRVRTLERRLIKAQGAA